MATEVLGTFCLLALEGKERHFKVAQPILGSLLINFSWWRECKVGASESKTSPFPLHGVLVDSPHYTSNLVSADLEYSRKSQIMLMFCKKGKVVDLSRKCPIPELFMSCVHWLLFPTSKNKTLQWCIFPVAFWAPSLLNHIFRRETTLSVLAAVSPFHISEMYLALLYLGHILILIAHLINFHIWFEASSTILSQQSPVFAPSCTRDAI